jgi:hypothetical protein
MGRTTVKTHLSHIFTKLGCHPGRPGGPGGHPPTLLLPVPLTGRPRGRCCRGPAQVMLTA